ncbi:hypothetical protein BX600DRAFT_519487 [Xylariales sp. PMI_506]|nr:hypothetical protein BX600DRAFT_519487 [Xylariales sp. PMI_506]
MKSSVLAVLFAAGMMARGILPPAAENRRATTSWGTLEAPSRYQSPRLRYWWPNGWIDPDEVTTQIEALYDAGFGGAEIADVCNSVNVPMDPAIYGWAQDAWNEGMLTAYDVGNKLGLHIDYTIGPQWPTGVPGFSPDSPETSKELVHGVVLVSAGETYNGSLPQPTSNPSGMSTANPTVNATAVLVAVLVAQTNLTSTVHSTLTFEPSTILNITGLVEDGTINWTAPTNGSYFLVAIYSRGTGQIQAQYLNSPDSPLLTDPSPAYIVDHLSILGVQASVDYWKANILTDDLRANLLSSNGSLFEDSLELSLVQYWTPDFLDEFLNLRGYDLTPYLLYVLEDTNTFSGDADTARAVQADFYQTVSDLYINNRLGSLNEFANSLGLKMRAQPYWGEIDGALGAARLDLPEGESLGFAGKLDAFRSLTSGRDIAGTTPILSCELGAVQNDAYYLTWKNLLTLFNQVFAYGVNQVVIHGYPYTDSPDSVWPGYSAFTPNEDDTEIGYSEAWGVRQPQWMFAGNASVYMARSMMLQQSGQALTDVAILNTALSLGSLWSDVGLNSAGYSYQFPTPALLAQYNVSAENGVLASSGPAYQALILNNIEYLNTDTAQDILTWAQNGLPVVVVGNPPNATISLLVPGVNATVSEVFSQILALSTSAQVATEADAPAALQALGIRPSVQYSGTAAEELTTVRRKIGNNQFLYWIYSALSGTYTVSLAGEGWPIRIDRWTGEATPLGSFYAADGYVTLNISIATGAAELIYLGQDNPYGAQTPAYHITAAAAEGYIDTSNTLYLRSTSNGALPATLSTGQTATLTFSGLPAAITLKAWNLTVQDWSPAIANGTGLNSSQTTKTTLPTISLTSLSYWSSIPALSGVSGVGVYSTQVNITQLGPTSGNLSTGVYLTLASIGGSWGVRINGQPLENPDWFVSRPLDVTSYLQLRINDIEVTVATTLRNKLRVTWPSIFGSAAVQSIGLAGPVILTYFGQQPI